MLLSLTLVDINPRLVAAWQIAFADAPEVAVVHGSLLQQRADVWVTPTNGRARMDGGVDALLVRHLGSALQARVQREVAQQFGGRLRVGCAAAVPTLGLRAPRTGAQPRHVISTATMGRSSEDVSRSDNAAWAFAAALHVATTLAAPPSSADDAGASDGDGIIDTTHLVRSLAVPGLGTSTGRMSARDAAEQMRFTYELFRGRSHGFADFDELHAALSDHLGTAPPPRGTRRTPTMMPPATADASSSSPNRSYYRPPKRKRRLFGLLAAN